MPYQRRCLTCGATFEALRSTGKFCSDRCRGHYWQAGKNRVTIPRDLRFRILLRDNFTCRWCGKRPPQAELTVDHVTSVADGGALTDPENLATACFDCNAGKGALSVDHDLLPSLGEFPVIQLRGHVELLESTIGARIKRWVRNGDGTYELELANG